MNHNLINRILMNRPRYKKRVKIVNEQCSFRTRNMILYSKCYQENSLKNEVYPYFIYYSKGFDEVGYNQPFE